MQDLISILDDFRSLDNKIYELSLKMNEIPITQAIEKKEKEVLHEIDELSQLHENIQSLFNEIYKKSEVEKDEETTGKLKNILFRIRNENI